MSLEVGRTYSTVGAHVDTSGFDRYERKLRGAREDAKRGATAKLEAHADTSGFDRYERKLRDVDDGHSRLIRGTGRVRSAFGSLAIGGAAVGAAGIGLGFLARGANSVVGAFQDSERTARRQALVIRTMGQDAGATAKHVDTLAASMEKKTGIDDDTIIAGANVIRTFKNIRNEGDGLNAVFDRAVKASFDMQAAFPNAGNAAIMLGKALDNPAKGAASLSRTGAIAKDDVEKLKKMAEDGTPILEQQQFVLAAVEKQVKGTAASNATATDKMKASWGELEEKMGSKIAPLWDRLTTKAGRFFDQITEGRGAGGRFAADIENGVHRAERAVEPLRQALARIWSDKDASFGDKIGRSLNEAAPFVANAAAKLFFAAAPRAATAFVNGFTHAGPLAQLFTVGFLASKLGVFSALGKSAADRFGGSFSRNMKFAGVVGGALALIGVISALGSHTKTTAEASRDLADALEEERNALKKVRDLDLDAAQAKVQARASALAVIEAERNLKNVRHESGRGSLEAKEAENNLAQARIQAKRDARALGDVEGDAAAARRQGTKATETAVARSKDLIGTLAQQIHNLKDANSLIHAHGAVSNDAYNKLQKLSDATDFNSAKTKVLADMNRQLASAEDKLKLLRIKGDMDTLSGSFRQGSTAAGNLRQQLIELGRMHVHPTVSTTTGGAGINKTAARGGALFVGGDPAARGLDDRLIVGPAGVEGRVAAGELLVFNGDQQRSLNTILTGAGAGGLEGFFGLPWRPHSSTAAYATGGILGKAKAQAVLGRKAAGGAPGLGKWPTIIEELERDYGQLDRKYGQSDEVFIVEDDNGAHIDKKAVKHRVNELTGLHNLRKKIGDKIGEYRRKVGDAIKAYNSAIGRVEKALSILGKRKGKKVKKARQGYNELLDTYRGRKGELVGIRRDLGQDLQDNRLDLGDIADEVAALGNKELAKQLPAPASPDQSGEADQMSAPDPSAPSTPETRPPSAEEIAAAAAAQVGAFNAGRADLFRTFGNNFASAGSMARAGAGGSELEQAAGARYLGAAGGDSGFAEAFAGSSIDRSTHVQMDVHIGGTHTDETTFAQRAARELRATIG